MKKLTYIILITLICGSIIMSCKHDPEGIDALSPVCFDSQIQPIFSANCNTAGCHDGTGESYNFTTYNGIMQGVKAGEPYESSVYKSITAKWGQLMPPKGNEPLTEEQRTLIYIWILQGATDTVTCNQ